LNYRFALLGHPVSHSLSGPMHCAALDHFKLTGNYRLLDVLKEQLQEKLSELIAEGIVGLNVTIPHKEAMFKLASSFTPEATHTQAANTIKVEKGQLIAHNTDIQGFQNALSSAMLQFGTKPESAVVLGAGGASRAALVALDLIGFSRILLIARNIEAAKMVLNSIVLTRPQRVQITGLPDQPARAVEETGDQDLVVVNTTPLGQSSLELPPWLNYIVDSRRRDRRLFFDMVYSRNTEPTPLVSFARARGWHGVDGTDMLVHQARAAFAFWTGNDPPYSVMRSALDKARQEKTI
jgi:shikimate dehydrogenase